MTGITRRTVELEGVAADAVPFDELIAAERPIILSLEQALSMPYGTLRFVHLGWRVIKVIWGEDWDALLAKDTSGLLVKRMGEVVDGQYQKYTTMPGVMEKFAEDAQLLQGLRKRLHQIFGVLKSGQPFDPNKRSLRTA